MNNDDETHSVDSCPMVVADTSESGEHGETLAVPLGLLDLVAHAADPETKELAKLVAHNPKTLTFDNSSLEPRNSNL